MLYLVFLCIIEDSGLSIQYLCIYHLKCTELAARK